MKSTKFYSLDECLDQNRVLSKLDLLADDRKIDYELVESDVIKIKDLSLTVKELKELKQFFHDNDVLEDIDFEEEEDDDEDIYNDDNY
jgi:hypothetical protein